MMNLAGQNWAAMELAQEFIDPWIGTTTPGRPVPTAASVDGRERLVGTYESIGSRLTVGTEGEALVIDIQPLESPDADSTIRGELLPVEGERFVLRAAAIGDDLPLTFVEPNGDGGFELPAHGCPPLPPRSGCRQPLTVTLIRTARSGRRRMVHRRAARRPSRRT